jgi:ABC-type lipoprotein release transport system permease subunit
MYFQLGWRNIWRNRRRTLVILTAVVIGVWSMICLGALMRGVADQMVRNGISTLTGHIQIHHDGYRNDPVIENSITDPEALKQALEKTLPPDALWAPRVRVNAIISNARHSSSVTMVGIDPSKEGKISFIKDAVSRGRHRKPDDRYGILVGEALLVDFETKLGRRMVLMAQNVQQEIASRAFEIVGVFKAELEATEKAYVFVTRPAAQEMLSLKKALSEVAVLLSHQNEAGPVADALSTALSSGDYEVHTWKELLPMVTAILKIYDWFIFLWFLVIFVAMAFGIVNTTLMAVFERIREFGLLKALGMKPWWILREVLTETFFLLVLGLLIGNSLGLLSVLALSSTGIDLSALSEGLEYAGMSRVIYPAIQSKDILMANIVVFGLGLLVSAYPAIKAARFTPVEALAHT